MRFKSPCNYLISDWLISLVIYLNNCQLAVELISVVKNTSSAHSGNDASLCLEVRTTFKLGHETITNLTKLLKLTLSLLINSSALSTINKICPSICRNINSNCPNYSKSVRFVLRHFWNSDICNCKIWDMSYFTKISQSLMFYASIRMQPCNSLRS